MSSWASSKESYDFDLLQANGFKKHVKSEHNIFQYMGFFSYLHDKDPEQYSSHEAFVVTNVSIYLVFFRLFSFSFFSFSILR